jgi:hypothetical protein
MRPEIRSLYGSDVGRFYAEDLKTTRKIPVSSHSKQISIKNGWDVYEQKIDQAKVTRKDQSVAERSIKKVQKDAAKDTQKKMQKKL